MAPATDKPKKSELLRRSIDFIFGLENKRGDVLDSWMYSADGLSFSPQEFYASVQQQMEARKIPDMEISHQEFAEGGMLSDRRLYLRLIRERLAITTCAAPFGTVFFFSCRTVYIRALVRLWHIVAAVSFFYAVLRMLIIPLGLTFAAIALVGLLFALAGVLRNAAASSLPNLDAILLRIPVVATIYEDWFREDTYYREDTRTLYLKLLPKLIQELAEETCAAKGIKLEPLLQRTPQVIKLGRPGPVNPETPS